MKNEVEDERFYQKSSEEATRWLQQSKSDLASARWLLRSGPPFSAHACFQSQQVVEKCLKGMLFYSCGISGQLLGSHDVLELARKAREETSELDEEDLDTVRKVARYYLPTRYPNRQPFNVVPANAFEKNEAETAVEAASKVLDLVEEYCL
jgi:HEPN domain-containing protein